MAVRNESVRLSLQDDFTSGMARATAATALFKRELNGLDGKRVSRDLEDTSTGIDSVGRSATRNGKEVDKLSGRMRIFADAALTLGPALIPIGAAAIPAITSAVAGLGVAMGGLGTALLALNGVGDGLKALDAYQLAPTVENLQKLRIEQEKLGPAGAQFVKYIDGLEGSFSGLQNVARAGWFPGLEDGIDEMLTRLPAVKVIVSELATGMGDLAREAGAGLAGPKFSAFFTYIETTAKPTLEAFGQATGNVAEGLANLFVAFAPLTSDFTTGLERMTESFAQWSRGLDQNKSFQDFLAYVRASGPEVAQLFSAIAEALVGVVRAAAPMGQVVLPALTALAQAFAAIANSPIGPPLYTAAAGLIAFNRAASLSSAASEKLVSSFASVTAGAEGMRGKLALIGTAGAAAALGLGTISDSMQILDSRSRSNDTLNATVKSLQDLEDTVQYSNLGKYAQDLHIDLPRLTDDLAKNGAQGEYVQRVQKQLEGSSHGVGAAFNALAGNILPFYTASADKAYGANKDLNAILGDVGSGLGKTKGLFGGVIDEMQRAKDAARDLSGALSELDGWFNKREALRSYRDSIHELSKSLKDGFQPKDAETLDAVGRNIIQVAQSIKSPALQRDFLASAKKSLAEVASGSGPKAQAAIQRVIDKMDALGLTHPKPKVDVDDKATPALDDLGIKLRRYGDTTATAKAAVDAGGAEATINAVSTMLRNLNGTTATTYVRTVRNDIPLPGKSADGGTVPKTGLPYADRHHYLLADGEEVISNRHGQADRHRSLLKAINAGRMADGGTAGGNQTFTSAHASSGGAGPVIQIWTNGVYTAAKALKALKAELDDSTKALDKEKQKREQIASARSSLSSSVSDRFSVDLGSHTSTPWAQGGGLQAMVDEATREASSFPKIIAALKKAGLTGPALQQALQQMSYTDLQQLATNPGQAAQLGSALSGLYSAQQVAGASAGDAVYGAAERAANRHVDAVRDEIRMLRHDIKRLENSNKKAHDDNAKKVTAGVNGAASNGHRRGQKGPR